MALPATIPVKIISDEAGSISITPIVTREMTPAELVEVVVAQTGKDPERVLHLLRIGTLVSGPSRLRWPRLDVDDTGIQPLLGRIPDPEPDRAFDPERCGWVAFQSASGRTIEVTREAGERRRLLRRRCFWDALLDVVSGESIRYVDYSYREKCDRYRVELSSDAVTAVRVATTLLPYTSLADRLRSLDSTALELYTTRER